MVSGRSAPATATSTRVSTRTTRNGAMAPSPGQMAIYSKATTRLIIGMAMAKCTGKMVATIKASGRMVFKMEKVCYRCLIQVNCLLLGRG